MRSRDMRRPATYTRFLSAFTTQACAMLFAGPVFAHAMLEHASLGAGAAVSVAPKTLALEYSEALEPGLSGVDVRDDNGDRVVDTIAVHDAEIAVTLKPLLPGRYRVTWHAVSVDGHRTQGAYTFTVTP